MKYIRRSLLALAFLLPIAASLKVWLAGHPLWLQESIYHGAGCAILLLVVIAPFYDILAQGVDTKLGHVFTTIGIIPVTFVPGLYLCLAAFIGPSRAERNTWHLLVMFMVMYHVIAIFAAGIVLGLLYAAAGLVQAVILGLARLGENSADAAPDAKGKG